MTRDARVDAYIENAAEFAQPILRYIRELMHATCPDIEEDIKWRAPAFMYHGLIGGMAAFKTRAGFGLWKASLIVPDITDKGMGGWNLQSISDLPPKKTLVGYIKKAMALNEGGVSTPRTPRASAKSPRVPADLSAALRRSAKAKAAFDGLSPSHRREYVEWIVEAKRPETRQRRIATAIAWIAEGKPRNWKYMRA
jgi:hypothetical protein